MDQKKSSIISGVRSLTIIKVLVLKHMMELQTLKEASTLLQSNHITRK